MGFIIKSICTLHVSGEAWCSLGKVYTMIYTVSTFTDYISHKFCESWETIQSKLIHLGNGWKYIHLQKFHLNIFYVINFMIKYFCCICGSKKLSSTKFTSLWYCWSYSGYMNELQRYLCSRLPFSSIDNLSCFDFWSENYLLKLFCVYLLVYYPAYMYMLSATLFLPQKL